MNKDSIIMIDKSILNMSYKDFNKYCNERACDGRWRLDEALLCTSIIERVQAVKVKGFFRRKTRLEEAREKEFRNIVSEII